MEFGESLSWGGTKGLLIKGPKVLEGSVSIMSRLISLIRRKI